MMYVVGFASGMFIGACIALFAAAVRIKNHENDAYVNGYHIGYNKGWQDAIEEKKRGN